MNWGHALAKAHKFREDAVLCLTPEGKRAQFYSLSDIFSENDLFEKVVAALQDRQGLVLTAEGVASVELDEAQARQEVLLGRAEAYRFSRELLSQANAERFKQQLAAYRQGGEVYLWREYLSALDEMMGGLRKFVFVGDHIDRWVYELDLKEKLQPDLFSGIDADIEETEK